MNFLNSKNIRAALSVKGSSAMRCCLFCRNVVKKNAGLEAYSDFFQGISSCNVDAFHEQTDQDFFEVWDNLLREKARCTKAVFNKKDIAARFNVCAHALLSDRVLRETIPPSAFLLDSMHLFWANGVVSWEVNSAYQQSATTNIGNLEAFLALPWCFTTAGNTKSWRVSMGHEYNFKGAAYKGSASNLMIFPVVPLLFGRPHEPSEFDDQRVGKHAGSAALHHGNEKSDSPSSLDNGQTSGVECEAP